MSFLIVSEGGDGIGLATRLLSEGHNATMWIRDPEAEKRGEGLVEKGSLPPGGEDVTLVADCTGLGAILDNHRSHGGRSFGGSQFQDSLESDRNLGSEIFRECDIKQPESYEFHSWEDAEAFVQEYEGDKLVFKPGGKLSGNLPSYVAYDNADMFRMLAHFKGIMGEDEPDFILQEFIKGVCISSEAWCAKGEILYPTNHTLERKQLMAGDLGPSGGCTGNVVWRCEGECPICDQLYKLAPVLKEHEYSGPIDINSVVNSDGEIYALEFTPRFGYDAFPTFLYGLFEGDFGAFINDCTRGSTTDVSIRNGFAAGVRVSVPPWPSEEFHARPDLPIGGLRESDFDKFYPYEVGVQKDSFTTSGGYGIIGVSVGYSEEGIVEAFEDAYKLCDRLRIPDKQYRNDLGEVFKKDLTQLRRSLGVSLVEV
jgi:phosphoribosylamine-glycine ligase